MLVRKNVRVLQTLCFAYSRRFFVIEHLHIAVETAISFIQKIMEVIAQAQAQDSHSPSKVTEALGKDAADGYVLGFENNQGTAAEKVRLFANNILREFSGLTGSFTQIGTQAMDGLINGMSVRERALFTKANGLANSIAETIRSALEIHSPSKVMFRLGDYTMQGFRDGMENLYQPILSSLEGFHSKLEAASLPDMRTFCDGYPNAVPVNGISASDSGFYDRTNVYRSDNEEMKSLLRHQNKLLYAILEKPVLDNGDVFRAVRAEYRQEAARLGAIGDPETAWG